MSYVRVGKAFRLGTNAEPALMLSAVFGLGALALPVFVCPSRREDGKPAHQYYSEDSAHLHPRSARAATPDFGDLGAVAKFAKHTPYKFADHYLK